MRQIFRLPEGADTPYEAPQGLTKLLRALYISPLRAFVGPPGGAYKALIRPLSMMSVWPPFGKAAARRPFTCNIKGETKIF